MDVILDHFTRVEDNYYVIAVEKSKWQGEIIYKDWFKQHNITDWYIRWNSDTTINSIGFSKEDDAVLFTLTWG